MINIEICNLVFSIRIDNPYLFRAIKEDFSLFIVEKIPQYYIEINHVSLSEFKKKFSVIGYDIKPVVQKESNSKFNFICSTSAVTFDFKSNRSIITTVDLEAKDISHTLLKDVIILRFMMNKSIMLHSCGIATPKGVFIFTGPSGSGKSTIACNSNGQTVLNDENIALRCFDKAIFAYGTPWFGTAEKASNIREKIKAIFFIKISERFECIKLTKAMSFFMLFHNAFLPFRCEEFLGLQNEICIDIIKSVPCYKLNFPYSMSNFWEFLLKLKNKELILC